MLPITELMLALSRTEIGDLGERLVAEWSGGTLAPRNNVGWDVRSAAHGRIQVKARSHASRHLNWFHIKNVDANTFDYLVLIEFEADLSLAGAWGMTHAAISDHAHSVVVDARGNRITKLAIRGDWKTRVDAIDLAIAQRPR